MSGRRQIYAERSARGAPAYDAPTPESEIIASQAIKIARLKASEALKEDEIARLRQELADATNPNPAPRAVRKAAPAPDAA